MITLIALFLGLVLALALVGVVRTKRPEHARRVYAVGLLVAALIYVVFALVGGANSRWLMLECLGVVLFGAAAWGGLSRWLTILAVGWVVHVGWDVLLHLEGVGAVYTPDGYPWLCVGFDLVLVGAVVSLARQQEVTASRPAE